MMGQPVEQSGGHLGVAEHAWPFAEGEVCGDDDRGLLIKPAGHFRGLLRCVERHPGAAFAADSGEGVLL